MIGIDAVRAKLSRYLPTVLMPEEVQQVIQRLYGVYKMVIQILYGSGLRLSEGLQLRVKDVHFGQRQLAIRDTKGRKSRVTMLSTCLIGLLQAHLVTVRQLHHQDLERGYGSVYLPFALEHKYLHSDRQWIWQYVFPTKRFSQDPRSKVTRRHHLHETGVRFAARDAVRAAGIEKLTCCKTAMTSARCRNYSDTRT